MAVIVLHYGDRSRMIARPDSWEDLIEQIYDFVQDLDEENDLTIFMKPHWASTEVELEPSAYQAVKHKTELRIFVRGCGSDCDAAYHSSGDENVAAPGKAPTTGQVAPACPTQAASETNTGHTTDGASVNNPSALLSESTINVITLTGKMISVRLALDATVLDLKMAICSEEGVSNGQQRLVFNGTELEDKATLKSYGMTSSCVVHMVLKLRAAKPVIFILTPRPIPQVDVTIFLSEQWRLTDLYPPTKDDTIKSHVVATRWRVMAGQSGILYDDHTGMHAPYLFWEAETVALTGLFNPSLGRFNPLAPELAPPNAAMMPMQRLIPYLDNELGMLFMDATKRADFITYWIRDFRHLEAQDMDIAISFVKQSEYEQAARLLISPAPDVVIRVFMIFGGVKRGTHSHAEWSRATARADPCWRDIIGVSEEAADLMEDESRYRVLEWGGMRVVPAALPLHQ